MHEDDAARALDDGRDHGNGIAPVNEAALRAGESRLAAALDGLKRGAAVRAIAIIRVRHD
jgi:hypothetical protein